MWSRGMISARGAGGPGFDSRLAPNKFAIIFSHRRGYGLPGLPLNFCSIAADAPSTAPIRGVCSESQTHLPMDSSCCYCHGTPPLLNAVETVQPHHANATALEMGSRSPSRSMPLPPAHFRTHSPTPQRTPQHTFPSPRRTQVRARTIALAHTLPLRPRAPAAQHP